MIIDRKLVKVVKNRIDLDLACSEYKVGVYDEILVYLSDNNCIEGVKLVGNRKMLLVDYVNNIKNDLAEIDNICDKIEILVKDSYKQKNTISSIIYLSNKKIYVNEIEKNYSFIYSIGFDEFTQLYKYGIIYAEINKGKLYKIEEKIGFSSENNLLDYADFKTYFNELLKEFNNINNLVGLDSLRNQINYDLSKIFNTENLRGYLAMNSENVKKLTGISGIEMMRALYKSYDINKVKIKLISNGYSPDDKLIDVVRTEMSCNEILDCLKSTDEIEDEKMRDFHIKILEKESEKVNFLLKELNMSSAELKTAVNKVNDEIK